jgi:hypothetical protein
MKRKRMERLKPLPWDTSIKLNTIIYIFIYFEVLLRLNNIIKIKRLKFKSNSTFEHAHEKEKQEINGNEKE